MDGHFSTAIQEWKNVLLRGKDPKDLEKYWASHLKEMQAVSQQMRTLVDSLRVRLAPCHRYWSRLTRAAQPPRR